MINFFLTIILYYICNFKINIESILIKYSNFKIKFYSFILETYQTINKKI